MQRPKMIRNAWHRLWTGHKPRWVTCHPEDWFCAVCYPLWAAGHDDLVIRIHHGDPDSHARSFNQGWDEALRDAIADTPEGRGRDA